MSIQGSSIKNRREANSPIWGLIMKGGLTVHKDLQVTFPLFHFSKLPLMRILHQIKRDPDVSVKANSDANPLEPSSSSPALLCPPKPPREGQASLTITLCLPMRFGDSQRSCTSDTVTAQGFSPTRTV